MAAARWVAAAGCSAAVPTGGPGQPASHRSDRSALPGRRRPRNDDTHQRSRQPPRGSVPGRLTLLDLHGTNHHPSTWSDPDRFDPRRFTPERKAALRKGAYVPFGGGSRTCIGMRFGEAEIAIITRTILERFRLELTPGHQLRIRQAPTISPAPPISRSC